VLPSDMPDFWSFGFVTRPVQKGEVVGRSAKTSFA
jgi:hypothetical protein